MNTGNALVVNDERIVCMVVVDDALSDALFGVHVDGCLRGWVLRDRKDNQLYFKWRLKYPEGKHSWHFHGVEPPYDKEKEEFVRDALEHTFRTTCSAFSIPVSIKSFYPPRELNPDETIQWLLDEDLIEMKYPEKLGVA